MLDQDTGEDAPCPTEVTQNLLDATWGLTPAHTAAWRDALDMTCALGPSVVVALRRAAMCKCQQIKRRDLSDQSHSTGRSQHANSQVRLWSNKCYLEIPFSGKRRDRRRCYHRLQGHSRGASHAGGSHGPPNSERSDAGYLAQEGEHHQDPTPIPDIGREAHSRACATAPPEIPPNWQRSSPPRAFPAGFLPDARSRPMHAGRRC